MPSNTPSTKTVDQPSTPSGVSSGDELAYMVYIPVDGEQTCYPIRISPGAFVGDLIEAVAAGRAFKEHVGSEGIYLYKCGEVDSRPRGRSAETRRVRYSQSREWLLKYERMKMELGELSEEDEREMEPELTIQDYFPSGPQAREGKIDVIAVTDAIRSRILSADQGLEVFTPSDSEPNPLRDCVSFKLYTSDLSILDWAQVIRDNEFDGERALPKFVKDIVDMSRSAPDEESYLWLSAVAEALLQLARRQGEDDEFSKLFRNLFRAEGGSTPYVAWNLELAHFAFAASSVVSPRDYGTFKEEKVRNLVLTWFETFWRREVDESECIYDKPLPFPVVGVLGDRTRTDNIRKWTPKPDATFLERGFPRFLVEIDSHCKNQDEYRLNVYAACVLRLMMQLRKERNIEDREVFLMAVFFSDCEDWKIERYFFFMDEENNVCRNLETFSARNPFELTNFLREFYNYAFHIKNRSTFNGPGPDMKELATKIGGDIKKSLHTNDLLNNSGGGGESKGNSKRVTRQGTSGSGSKPSDGLDIRTTMVEALHGTDYALEEYHDGFAPFIDLPNHIAEARDSNRKELIVKLVRKRCNERFLLEELSKQESPLNHVVPLVNTIVSKAGPLLVLERGSSLLIQRITHKDKSERLSRNLIEGVAFLHAQRIAHLDIKPDNLILDYTGRLLIIDFDVAMKCNGVEEMVERKCGTEEWSAPEIVLEVDKPVRAFSPIRADLWSCGRVLRYIAGLMGKEGGNSRFIPLANKLMVGEPRRRPLLHEVVKEETISWTTEELLKSFGCQIDKDEVEETIPTIPSLSKKRPREDVSSGNEGDLAPKLLKEPRAATVHSASSESSTSADSLFDLASLSDRSDYIEDIHPDQIELGKTSLSQFTSQKRDPLPSSEIQPLPLMTK